MPKIQNVSPCGDLDVPLLRRIVRAGEVVDVTDEQAERLLPQSIWWAVDSAAEVIQAQIDRDEFDELAETDESDGEVTGDDVAE